MMYRFELLRHHDVTGVSGTGTVAEGVIFSDGTVVMRWLGAMPTTVVHEKGLPSVEKIHLHNDSSELVFLED